MNQEISVGDSVVFKTRVQLGHEQRDKNRLISSITFHYIHPCLSLLSDHVHVIGYLFLEENVTRQVVNYHMNL